MFCKGIDERLWQLNGEFASVGYWAALSISGLADYYQQRDKKTQITVKYLRCVLATYADLVLNDDSKAYLKTFTEERPLYLLKGS